MESYQMTLDWVTEDLSARCYKLKSGRECTLLDRDSYESLLKSIEDRIHMFKAQDIIMHLEFLLSEFRQINVSDIRLKPGFEEVDHHEPDEREKNDLRLELRFYFDRIQELIDWATTKKDFLEQERVIVTNQYCLCKEPAEERMPSSTRGELSLTLEGFVLLFDALKKKGLVLNYETNTCISELVRLCTGFSSEQIRKKGYTKLATISKDQAVITKVQEQLREVVLYIERGRT